MPDSPRTALLFAGQGAQTVGMGQDLAADYPEAKELFVKANEVLGFNLEKVMFEGPEEELTRTSRCQPALYVHGLACFALLKKQRPELEVAAAAGLSLGELTAHAAAGTFSFEDGLRLVSQRGQFMEAACEETEGTMAAMIGGEEKAVRELAASVEVDVANFNAPGQIVLSGTRSGIQSAIDQSKVHGIRRAIELQVAGAYHSRLMASAEAKLAAALADVEIRDARFPVICNVEARATSSADDVRQTLAAQVTGSVRWEESMRLLLDGKDAEFIELGPGGVLAGLLKKTNRSAKVTTMATSEAFQSLDAQPA
ncbi:MAG: ACP S-malonyltransferase [Verrucomicrobiota bacterium]